MPTGYTADLHDGKSVTFESFVLKCARAMGAAIMQRDDPADVAIQLREVEDYYYENVQKAKAELSTALTRSIDYWDEQQEKEISEAIAYREKYISDQAGMEGRYTAMLEQVRDWVPPTPEHDGLKKFMIEQLESSIEFDTRGLLCSFCARPPACRRLCRPEDCSRVSAPTGRGRNP